MGRTAMTQKVVMKMITQNAIRIVNIQIIFILYVYFERDLINTMNSVKFSTILFSYQKLLPFKITRDLTHNIKNDVINQNG